MKYLPFETVEAAEARSREEALARGCDPKAVTQFWWSVVTDDGVKLAIPDEDHDRISMKERAALKSDDGEPAVVDEDGVKRTS